MKKNTERSDSKRKFVVASMTTRRNFLKAVGLAGAAIALPGRILAPRAWAQLPGGSLDPTDIPKYRLPLFIPPAMPRSGRVRGNRERGVDYYEIAVRQFRQRILPTGFPTTTVWGYGSVRAPGTVAQGGSFSYPAFTIEADQGTPVRVKWINDLKHPVTGQYLPHLLPVDQTLHWANPPGPRDMHTMNPEPYRGPIPLVTHLHGGHSGEESDGYPEAWYLPAASNLPAGHFTEGTWYSFFKNVAATKLGVNWEPGTATFEYANDQRAATPWYHDHSLGIVRQNIYAGPVGFYLIRGGPGDEVSLRFPGARRADRAETGDGEPYEIPLVIQDRSFNSDGSLFYPASREFFDGFAGPYIPDPTSDISPLWNAEFFGNTIVVNGRTWPWLRVERRRYRFRLLNACNSRFLILKFDGDLPFWQLGADGGFLRQPARTNTLLLSPAERADVVVDFSRVRAGTRVTLLNLAPDEPFGGGTPGVDFAPAYADTTGQVMQFRVVARTGPDRSTAPEDLELPEPEELGDPVNGRRVSFNELDSELLPDVGPRQGLLGIVDLNDPSKPMGVPLRWMDDVTETPATGTTEVWEIHNFTEDAHPFHLHQVQFEILQREVPDLNTPGNTLLLPPEPSETGRKDTLITYPGTITRLKAHFDLPGRYVWHCHILEHEDNEMMRPLQVV